MRFTLLLIFASILPLHASAQPAEISRVLKRIDFEERRLGNEEDLPMHWAKVEGPGLPHYVNGRLSADRAHAGKYSFRFDLDGGSLLYRYDANQIPVQHGAHYRVEAYAQTTPLPHARARLTAYFVDVDGHLLPDSIHHSDLYAAPAAGPPPADPWKQLSVELSTTDRRAAFLVIELGLLQPMHYATHTLGQRTLFDQDIRGTAWFDDVTVSQVPHVHLSTERPANIFRRSDPLRLNVVVNDRFTDDLAAQVIVRDATGRSVFQRSGAAEFAAAASGLRGEKRLTLALPDLPPGWYDVSLSMSSGGVRVGDHNLALVRLADDAEPVAPDPRFGVISTDLPFEAWHDLPGILPLLGASRVKLAVWTRDGDVEQLDSAAFDQMLVRLAELHIRPTACLLDLPPDIASRMPASGDVNLPPHSMLHLLKARPEDWQPQLQVMLAKHANHLDRWQLGRDGSEAFVTQKGMRQVYDRVYGEFAKLIESPDLAMPWPAWYEMTGQLPATIALSVPTSVLPHQLPLYMQELRGEEAGASRRHNLSLSLQPLDRDEYGRDVQIRDVAQRVIYALAAGASRIDIPLSFTVARDGNELVARPQELFLILRTLMRTLNGAKFVGMVPVAEGVEAFLFQRPDGSAVVALWDTGKGGGSIKSMAINLGDSPTRVDLWGNATPLLRSRDEKDSVRVQLAYNTMPIFLTGVDGPLLQMRASVAFDRPLLESSFRAHSRRFQFRNPYRTAVSGTVRLRGPDGWTLTPSTFNYSLNPGELFDRELRVEFPYNTFAGPKSVKAEFLVQANQTQTFGVPLTVQLGLSDVGMQCLALRDGRDVVVQQIIQNYGDQTINYSAFATCPGQSRQERLVTNLGAGRTTIKRYRFSGASVVPGTKVRVGVKEIEGTRILNDEVEIQ